jgi:hypothetical protein
LRQAVKEMPEPSATAAIYQLRIALLGIRPPIWRRVQVRSDVRLSRLHEIFQVAMGWTDSHLHQFIIDGQSYGEPDMEYAMPLVNDHSVRLAEVVSQPRTTFRYEYDFGDSWEHNVLVEEILDPVYRQRYPVCLDGRRACPPEDVGGVEGYRQFLAAVRDSSHEDHEAMLEWVGGQFDPTALDLASVNRRLARLR